METTARQDATIAAMPIAKHLHPGLTRKQARAESPKCIAKDGLPFATGFRSREKRQPWGVWGASLERFYWRNRETDEHLKGAVENIKDVITGQATILALCPLRGGYDDAAITCAALGTDNIGFPHRQSMGRRPGFFQ
jgi:hypothetical protein